MNFKCLAIALALLVSTAPADPSPAQRRDRALKEINACLRSNAVSSHKCKKLNKAVNTLVDVYKQGDKTVLPTLLQFTYLTDFFDGAIIADPNAFLAAMSNLKELEQKAVADGLAGGMVGLPRDRFEKTRGALQQVPSSSPYYALAQECLKTLNTKNGLFLVNYFPPQTFNGPGADFILHWYSSGLYALGEKPLWPVAPSTDVVYRLTILGSWSSPRAFTVKISSDGTGLVTIRAASQDRGSLETDKTISISRDQVARISTAMDDNQFWELPTQVQRLGTDGAEWLLEGARNGHYHLVDRWCPGASSLGAAIRPLLDTVGYHVSAGGC